MPKTTISQQTTPLNNSDIDAQKHLIIVINEDKWPRLPYQKTLEQRYKRSNISALEVLSIDLPNDNSSNVTLARIGKNPSSFDLLTLARKLAAAQLKQSPQRIAVLLPRLGKRLGEQMAKAIIAALSAANYPMPAYKSKTKAHKPLKNITFLGLAQRLDFKRTVAEADGNNLARELTTLPPNKLTPALYRKRLSALSKKHGWKMRTYGIKALEDRKAGAFLAVAQGSSEKDACIVHLRYTPSKAKKAQRLALVGKGICFDTGGVNLKPAKHMLGMHEDMQGSAVALGTLLALSQLKVPFQIDCWLALAQNHIGPRAYKQNDVVTAHNGTTIEIMHTDAEGRMVLADTLSIASEQKPQLMLDYATLTGTCVYALGTRYSGAFTNRDALTPQLIEAGRSSGERVWPFPLDEDYDSELDSKVADVKQCSLDGTADHILAAHFLKRFVSDIPWVHIDLASGNHKGGLAHIPTDITGFGVRYTTALLLDNKLLDTKLLDKVQS